MPLAAVELRQVAGLTAGGSLPLPAGTHEFGRAEVPGTRLEPAASTPAAAPVRYAVFKGGTVHLHGSVPTRAIADETVAKAGAVVGPATVVDQYVIDPATPYVDSAPLYVEDRVLFAFGSAEIEPDFIPLLDLGKILLVQNPNVTITVVGHTDSSGSPELNQRSPKGGSPT